MKSLGGNLKSIWPQKRTLCLYASSILHTETVVAVQELARFRKRALPSHFLLNCAITWRHHKGKYHYTKGRKRVVFHSHRNLPRRCKSRKAQPHRDPGKEKLHFTSYIYGAWREISEENSRLGNLLQFLAHERYGSFFSSVNFHIFTANELWNYSIFFSFRYILHGIVCEMLRNLY